MTQFISLLLLCSLALSTTRPAATGVLTGRVLDDEGKALIGATVRLQGTRIGGLSSAPDGRFTISGIKAGDYTVEITALGQASTTCSAKIVASKTTDLGAIALAPASINMNSVVVRSDRPAQRETVSTTRSVTTEVVERRQSIAEAIDVQSGPATSATNGLSLRGGRATEGEMRVDGVADGQGSIRSNPVSAEHGTALSVSPAPAPSTAAKANKLSIGAPPAAPLRATSGTIVDDPTATEDYAKIYENQFLVSHVSPVSTFSIDVDRASYSNVRRMLTSGYRPPADAVRIEELVNYFDYEYPEPDDEAPFGINTEMSECPWAPEHRLVRIGLQGKRMRGETLPPSHLTFLIDVSGSMSSTDKLPLLKQGFKLLIDQMRKQDKVAIVVYAGAAGLVLPMTSGEDKAAIHAALDRLQSGGSTAGAAGIELAYKVARENFMKDGNNRVILATDGDFNVGVSSHDGLVKLIEERRKDGVFLTVLGFGTGNYQDAKMEQLADKGNGNYAYVDNINEARKVFVDELGATIFTIAKDVKIQVVFSPERVESYRLIGYENRMLATEDFDDDLKDAGELGAGHSVTALYEIVPRGASSTNLDGWIGRKDTLDLPQDWKEGELVRVRLRYKLPESDVSSLIEGPVVERGVKLSRTSDDFRFAAAVAQFGMLLRDSRHMGASSYDNVLRLANGAVGLDAYGYRKGFIELVNRARAITPTASK